MTSVSVPNLVAEFLGTFLLVFTVGCNVLSSNPVWAGVSIACVLMVSIYALAPVSGANFNPAVSMALGFARKMGWAQVTGYCVAQIIGGIAAGAAYAALFGEVFNLGPTAGFQWQQAMACETLYTFMLCFVVLNTAASKKIGGKNQFYGLAIGFVIVAGAYGPGAVSGGCFNPAVAFGIDIISAKLGFGWCVLYTAFEMVGAIVAVAAFLAMRPEERDDAQSPEEGYRRADWDFHVGLDSGPERLRSFESSCFLDSCVSHVHDICHRGRVRSSLQPRSHTGNFVQRSRKDFHGGCLRIHGNAVGRWLGCSFCVPGRA